MSILAPISMLVSARWLLTLTYFWGIGLSSQGFITPVESAGPEYARFWIFWIAHVQIVGIGLYHVIVGGYRPQARDVAVAMAAGLVYLALIMAVNEVWGVNYGYVGSADEQPGIVAKLGGWPLRVVWMVLLGWVGFVVLWLPWRLVEWWRAGAGRSNGVGGAT